MSDAKLVGTWALDGGMLVLTSERARAGVGDDRRTGVGTLRWRRTAGPATGGRQA